MIDTLLRNIIGHDIEMAGESFGNRPPHIT